MNIDLIVQMPPNNKISNPTNMYKLTVYSTYGLESFVKSIRIKEVEHVLERVKLLLFWFNTVNELYEQNTVFISYPETIYKTLEEEIYNQKYIVNAYFFWNSIIDTTGGNLSQPTKFHLSYFNETGVECPVGIVVDGKSLEFEVDVKDFK